MGFELSVGVIVFIEEFTGLNPVSGRNSHLYLVFNYNISPDYKSGVLYINYKHIYGCFIYFVGVGGGVSVSNKNIYKYNSVLYYFVGGGYYGCVSCFVFLTEIGGDKVFGVGN